MPDVMIAGPAGRIEAKYFHHKHPNAPLAIILHPHPEHGGTMNNKITYNLYRTFAERGFNTVRFNFRGVGNSEGTFDNGEGELSDAAAVLDWMQAHNPNAPFAWVGGFSFGAWIGMQLLMRRPELNGFISVSPPANMYDFTFLAPCPVSGLMIQGTADELVTAESVEKLAQRLSSQRGIKIEYKEIQGADHFFDGHLDTLNDSVAQYLESALVMQDRNVPKKVA